MPKINNIEIIKKLRDETGAGVMRTKTALEDERKRIKAKTYSPEVIKAAQEILRKEGFEKVAKRQDRVTGQGIVTSYLHHSGKIGVLVEIQTETDFVAKNELTVNLGKEIALQIASMNPKDVKELENQEFIKDPKKKISELVKEVIAKTGENIKIGKFARIEVGK